MRYRTRRHSPYMPRWAAAVALLCLCIAALRGWRIARTPSLPPSRTVAVYMTDTGRIETMELEEYLVGVVGAEMPASFPLEALKAQAVAARTYSVRRLEGCGSCSREGADVCTDSGCCQAYRTPEQLAASFGMNAKRYMDKLKEAVYSTAGQIACYEGQPIEALYHSAAGGHTEDAQNVFSSALPYLIGVDSPGEEASGKYRAEKRYSLREFTAAVNRRWPDAGLKKSKLKQQVEILSRFESGQVKKLRLGSVTVSGKEFRKALSLNSANFTLEISSSVSVCTTGYGHGVGMSQYGARAMALEGADYISILRHYYTGIDVVNME